MAYCLAELQQREHEQFFEARHSGGYLERIVALHPLADRVIAMPSAVARRRFSERQEVIEGSAYGLHLPRWLAPINLMISQYLLLREVRRIVREERLEFVIATDALYSGLFGSWVSRMACIPLSVLFVSHYEAGYEATGALGMPRMFPFKWLQDAVIRHVARRADLIGASSQTLADYAVAMGGNPDAVALFSTAKNMTSSNRIDPADRGDAGDIFAEHNIPTGVPLFITIARHAQVKLVDHAIRAFAMVVERHPQAILLLAGRGPETGALETLVTQLDIASSVRFMGLQGQSVLNRLSPQCISLSPATGMALFETSMAGAPAIAYDMDSQIADLVVSGVTGELVRYKDWRAMGDAAIRLLDDPDRLAEMRRAMLLHARALTDEAAIHRVEVDAYEAMLARYWGVRA
jgi:glycosyltransferase involved in cell wall biosynthesis